MRTFLLEKTMLLDELLQLERTAQIIRSASSDDPSAETTTVPRSPIDVCYGKLHCDLNVMKPDCSEYQLIQEMIKNTHGDTHRNFSLSKSIPTLGHTLLFAFAVHLRLTRWLPQHLCKRRRYHLCRGSAWRGRAIPCTQRVVRAKSSAVAWQSFIQLRRDPCARP